MSAIAASDTPLPNKKEESTLQSQGVRHQYGLNAPDKHPGADYPCEAGQRSGKAVPTRLPAMCYPVWVDCKVRTHQTHLVWPSRMCPAAEPTAASHRGKPIQLRHLPTRCSVATIQVPRKRGAQRVNQWQYWFIGCSRYFKCVQVLLKYQQEQLNLTHNI